MDSDDRFYIRFNISGSEGQEAEDQTASSEEEETHQERGSYDQTLGNYQDHHHHQAAGDKETSSVPIWTHKTEDLHPVTRVLQAHQTAVRFRSHHNASNDNILRHCGANAGNLRTDSAEISEAAAVQAPARK